MHPLPPWSFGTVCLESCGFGRKTKEKRNSSANSVRKFGMPNLYAFYGHKIEQASESYEFGPTLNASFAAVVVWNRMRGAVWLWSQNNEETP